MNPEIKQNDRAGARRVVLHETGVIAIGVVVLTGIMVGVFALLGRFSMQVLLGGVAGAVLAILNFFFMAVNASQAIDKAANQDVKGGQKQLKMNYGLRMIVLFVILFALVKGGICNPLSSVLPLAFVRPVITIAEFFRK